MVSYAENVSIWWRHHDRIEAMEEICLESEDPLVLNSEVHWSGCTGVAGLCDERQNLPPPWVISTEGHTTLPTFPRPCHMGNSSESVESVRYPQLLQPLLIHHSGNLYPMRIWTCLLAKVTRTSPPLGQSFSTSHMLILRSLIEPIAPTWTIPLTSSSSYWNTFRKTRRFSGFSDKTGPSWARRTLAVTYMNPN